MKKINWIYIIGAGYLAWWLLRKKKTGANASTAIEAGNTAKEIVSEAIDQTTFLPDKTTFRDMYEQDQSTCK